MRDTYFFLFASLVTAAIAAFYDLRWWRIPNWLSLGVLVAAPLAHFAWGAATRDAHAGLVALGWSAAGAAACGFVPWLCWHAGTFGGGDVKLLAAVGALCLPRLGITIEFYAMISGVLFALGHLAYDGRLLGTLARSAALVVNPLLPKARRRPVPPEAMTPMRFAPAILGGVVLCALLEPR
jgi:prepilin peptidase CpaA